MKPLNLSYLLNFEFEKVHDELSFDAYMQIHWADSFVYSAVYIILVFGGQHFMRHRKRFELRPFLAAWSSLLAIFSILGAVRTLPELVSVLENHGWKYSVCVPSFMGQGNPTSFWVYLFVLSKVIELGDTLFIVLRKQNLIFLHWYHHITVLMYVWYTYTEKIASARWFMVMNFCVHSIMYSYYALRALRIRVPVQVNMLITSLQLVQMMIGILASLSAFQYFIQGDVCSTTYNNFMYCTAMYGSYLVLFAHFFYTTYIAKNPAVHANGKKHN